MQHDEFIGQVQARARLSSRGDAERATRATLETLGQRLAGGLKDELAAQLPQEIGLHLNRMPESGSRFGLDEFFQRVGEREGTALPAATHHARAVVDVLEEAVSPSQIAKLAHQFPQDYAPLLSSGSASKLRD